MDKIEILYEKGWRAYQNHDGGKVLYLNGDYINTLPSGHNNDSAEWHSLRAYQDAERKKGEPIRMKYPEINKFWYGRSFVRDGVKYCFCGEENPESEEIGGQIIPIENADMHTYPLYGVRYGGFKNFRWKAGHPKSSNIADEYISKFKYPEDK